MWRGVLFGAALLLPGASPIAGDSCPCPSTAWGWMIYPDPIHEIPDFFDADRVVLQEIIHCPHGLHFLFVSEQNGVTHLTALVIVRPYDGVLSARLGAEGRWSEYARKHNVYRRSYDDVLSALIEASGGRLTRFGRVDFSKRPIAERPTIDPTRKLLLHWNGREIPVRGYLDVYYTLVG